MGLVGEGGGGGGCAPLVDLGTPFTLRAIWVKIGSDIGVNMIECGGCFAAQEKEVKDKVDRRLARHRANQIPK